MKNYLSIFFILLSFVFTENYKISPVFVTYMLGKTSIKYTNDYKWNEVKDNIYLYSSVMLKTGENSGIDIVLNKETKLYIGEKTILKLMFNFDKQYGKEIFSVNLSLYNGSIKIKTLLVQNKNRIKTSIFNKNLKTNFYFNTSGDNSIYLYNNMNDNIVYLISEKNNLYVYFNNKDKTFVRKNKIFKLINKRIILRDRDQKTINKFWSYTFRKKIYNDIDLITDQRKW